jgi:hypothetical protein
MYVITLLRQLSQRQGKSPGRFAAVFVAWLAGLSCHSEMFPLSAAQVANFPAPQVDAPSLDNIRVAALARENAVSAMTITYSLLADCPGGEAEAKRYLTTEYKRDQTCIFAFSTSKNKQYYRQTNAATSVQRIAPNVEYAWDLIPDGARRKKQFDDFRAAEEEMRKQQLLVKGASLLPLTLDIGTGLETMFDGKVIYRQTPGEHRHTPGDSKSGAFPGAAIPADSPLAKSSQSLFPQDYLRAVMMQVPAPFQAAHDSAAGRLSTALSSGRFTLESEKAPIDGTLCVVLKSEQETVWVDPGMEYAVRRHDWFHPNSQIISRRITNSRFENIDGRWLPKEFVFDFFGPPGIPANLQNISLERWMCTVKEISLKEPPDSQFDFTFAPGQILVDDTLPTIEERERMYAMPASQEQLDAFVSRSGRRWLMWANIAIVAALAILTVLVRKRRKHAQAFDET